MSDQAAYQPLSYLQHQNKIKASRFIAEIFPVHTQEEIESHIQEVKKREYTANHHCFAWRLGTGDREQWRVSDDGEPSGTAGKPIYQVLVGAALTNILVIVTRYFGGTKLGKGGLIRAYGGVVQEAIPELRKEAYISLMTLECQCDFEHSNLVYRLIESHGADIKDQEYAEGVKILIDIRADDADKFAWELHELSHGIIKAHPIQ